MPVRAITFDFWGTLFQDAHSEERQMIRLDALVEATGVPREAAADAMRQTFVEFQRSHMEDQRTLTPLDAVQLTCVTLNAFVDPFQIDRLAHVFATAILEYPPVPIEGALAAVRVAAERFPIGLISDTGVSPGSSLQEIMVRTGFATHFKALTFSDVVGVSKPQAAMFETAARQLGVRPAGLFHIGDLQPTDIAGVQNVGGKAALFAGVNTAFADNTTAEHTFRQWEEFITLLPSLV